MYISNAFPQYVRDDSIGNVMLKLKNRNSIKAAAIIDKIIYENKFKEISILDNSFTWYCFLNFCNAAIYI